MPTAERLIDRGRRIAQRDRLLAGSEIRSARVGLGISAEELGRRAGISRSQVSRIERGVLEPVSVEQLACLGAIVGLDARLRMYPGADPGIGAPQNAVLTRLVARLHADVGVRTEVPLPLPGDQRAWDAVLDGLRTPDGTSSLPIDIETRLHDPQGQTRRLMLKLRDSGLDHVLLVLAETHHNRAAFRAAASLLGADFPVSQRRVMAALAKGEHPGGSAIVFV